MGDDDNFVRHHDHVRRYGGICPVPTNPDTRKLFGVDLARTIDSYKRILRNTDGIDYKVEVDPDGISRIDTLTRIDK